MNSLPVTLALLQVATPGAGGWLVLVLWFVLFVLVLNTLVFTLRRLFRRWRNHRAGANDARRGGKRI